MRNNMFICGQDRCRELVVQARTLISHTLPIENSDESSVAIGYEGFYLQIVFSATHPLIVFYLVCPVDRPFNRNDARLMNILNLSDVLGSHAINTDTGLYLYRTVHWLSSGLTKARLFEILEYSIGEARQAYDQLVGLEVKNETV